MSPRLAIFDFDGTLADSWPWLLGAMDEVACRFGFRRISPEEAEALRGQDSRAVIRQLGVPMWRLPQIAAHLRQLAAEAPPPPLFPGVPEMLQALAGRGITLAIASSNSEAAIRRALGPGLAALIPHLACEASLFGKAQKFRRLLRATGVPPGQAIAIGDETRDVEAAREAGIACGTVAWGYAASALLRAHHPEVSFDSPAEICRYFGA